MIRSFKLALGALALGAFLGYAAEAKAVGVLLTVDPGPKGPITSDLHIPLPGLDGIAAAGAEIVIDIMFPTGKTVFLEFSGGATPILGLRWNWTADVEGGSLPADESGLFDNNGTFIPEFFHDDDIEDAFGGLDLSFFPVVTRHLSGMRFSVILPTSVSDPAASSGAEFFLLVSHGTWTVRAAVPEPATLALVGLGLAGLAMARRRLAA